MSACCPISSAKGRASSRRAQSWTSRTRPTQRSMISTLPRTTSSIDAAPTDDVFEDPPAFLAEVRVARQRVHLKAGAIGRRPLEEHPTVFDHLHAQDVVGR